MILPPWSQYELGRLRMRRALDDCDRDCQIQRARAHAGVRAKLGTLLGAAGLLVLIGETLRTLFAVRREATGL